MCARALARRECVRVCTFFRLVCVHLRGYCVGECALEWVYLNVCESVRARERVSEGL